MSRYVPALAAAFMTALIGGTALAQTPMTDHLVQAPKSGTNMLAVGGSGGDVLVINGCAYHVNTTRNKISPDELATSTTTLAEGRSTRGTATGLSLMREGDGKPVCSDKLTARAGENVWQKQGADLDRLKDHTIVVWKRPDGCRVAFDGLYGDRNTGKSWLVSDYTKHTPLFSPDGKPWCGDTQVSKLAPSPS